MSTQIETGDRLRSYDEAAAADPAGDAIQPRIPVLAGQTIHTGKSHVGQSEHGSAGVDRLGLRAQGFIKVLEKTRYEYEALALILRRVQQLQFEALVLFNGHPYILITYMQERVDDGDLGIDHIVMAALTTVFTHSSWCSNRFAVFVDDLAPGTSVIPPSSGWVDPSFTKCIPTQYTTVYPTFSPGVCPAHMGIVNLEVEIHDDKTIYTAVCCQSGFSPISIGFGYLCTSAITSPMAFLLDPDISTADVYTTLPPELWIEHDQMTVQWEPTDLELFPVVVASQYARLMGITAPPSTDNFVTETTKVPSSSARTLRVTASPITSIIWPTPTPKTSATTASELGSSTSENDTNNSLLKNLGSHAFFIFLLVGLTMILRA
ncbi:hypothetical protein F5B21DRAFT_525461 [Xylaria acuta]|nr:hypothetical protein F5B21DRAFT_525461 [Xylaria acuta]